MKCFQCGFDNNSNKQFCSECGTKLRLKCPQCASEIEERERFCGSCGYDLRKSSEVTSLDYSRPKSNTPTFLADKILTTRGSIEGERRVVTVLFADMVDYTVQAERLVDEANYIVIQHVVALMMDAVSEHGGTVQDLAGDGILSLFGIPVALENAPLRACQAALAIQQQFIALSTKMEAEYGVRPRVRIGINSGSVVLGKVGSGPNTEFKAVGDTINLAARIESLAEPGCVLLSEATHRLVEGFVESTSAGEHKVKGKLQPQQIWQLESIKPDITRFDVAKRRGLTRLVGREEELETLKHCWGKTSIGEIHIVDVSGEAGIGKSRLIHEFRQRLGDDKMGFLQGHCTAEGRTTPFLPFLQVLRSLFRIGDNGNTLGMSQKLRIGLEILGLETDRHLPYLANLLGQEAKGALRDLDPEVIGVRTRETIQVVLRERCRLSPVVLLIDDLQWIDTVSESLLLWAAQNKEAMPLLMLCAYRPEYRPPWAGRANVIELPLLPLSRGSIIDLLRHRLGADELPDELTAMFLEKAEGNPLFAEEMTSYLLETGRIQQGEVGVTFQTDGAAGEGIGLPSTLENLLMERVDRLDERLRQLLKVASVVGRRFSPDLVGDVSGFNDTVSAHLEELEGHELIFSETAHGSVHYWIKHALIQEAIYNSLLSAERQTLHAAVGSAIERAYSGREGEVADVLAHHYNHTSQVEKTMRYLVLAGEKSLRVYAIDDAYERFRQALDLVEAHPGLSDNAFIADLVLNLARINYFRCDFLSIIEIIERYMPVVETLGDKRRLSRFLFELGFSHMMGARAGIGRPLLERALALGRKTGDGSAVGHAAVGLIIHHTFWEEPGPNQRETIRSLGQELIEKAKESADNWPMFKGLFALALHAHLSGNPREVRRYARRLMELSRETNDHRALAMGLSVLAYLDAVSGAAEEGIEKADEARRLALAPVDRANYDVIMGIALTMAGRASEGHELLRDVRQRLVAGNVLLLTVAIDLHYGVAQVMRGELAKGVRWIEETMPRLAEWGFRSGHGMGHLMLGNVYLNIALGEERPPPAIILKNLGFLLRTVPFAAAKARRHLEEAVRFFRIADLPLFLASALMSLGLLAKAKKQPTEARAHLEEARHIAHSVDAWTVCEKIDEVLEALN